MIEDGRNFDSLPDHWYYTVTALERIADALEQLAAATDPSPITGRAIDVRIVEDCT